MAKKRAGSLRRMFGGPAPSNLLDVPPKTSIPSNDPLDAPEPEDPSPPPTTPEPTPPPAVEPEPAPEPEPVVEEEQEVEAPSALTALQALMSAHGADPTALPEPRLRNVPRVGLADSPTVLLPRHPSPSPSPAAAAPTSTSAHTGATAWSPPSRAVAPAAPAPAPAPAAAVGAETVLSRPDARMSPEAKGALLVRYVAGGQSIEGLPFFDASLTAARLMAADLRGGQIQRAELSRADLRGADLRGADLRGVVMRSADLRGADLRGARLELARLEAADLRHADLREVSFARVSGMADADLRGADLYGVELVDAMRGARIDAVTVSRSDWSALHLIAARGCGLRLEGLDRLPPALRRPLEGPPEGLTLHFGTRLTFMDEFILRGALCAIVGSDADCQLHTTPEARGCVVAIQSAHQDSDLAEVAEALHGRVWEREPTDEAERSLMRRLFEVFPHARLLNELSSLVDRLERIDHRDHGAEMSWRPPVEPEAAFQHLLLKLFIPVELRWWLACIPGGKQLVRDLPSRDDAPEAVVTATIRTLARRDRIDAALFSSLIEERPRREPEIRGIARLWGVEWYAFRDPDE